MAKPCPATMVAKFDENHIHVCRFETDHEVEPHMCVDETCRRYFWKKGQLV